MRVDVDNTRGDPSTLTVDHHGIVGDNIDIDPLNFAVGEEDIRVIKPVATACEHHDVGYHSSGVRICLIGGREGACMTKCRNTKRDQKDYESHPMTPVTI